MRWGLESARVNGRGEAVAVSEERCEMLVGLEVLDEERYAAYRAGMKPLLHAAGGRFVCDFRVSEVLPADVTGEVDPRINRVFVLSFPDEAAKDGFFADPAYAAVRAEHFEGAVGVAALLA